ncbi:acetyl-CoA acetyltransferase [Streptococcus pneumoniae]|jgi:acetyl-CoA C-acetyltransferase|uniref:Acetyl-CoA C-acyltransferase family protein n=1 Tax=Stutzerimonas stutzeri TaxID=316 RepID=A0AA40V796_STUST|nr:acetyl-CoA C-acyltransferase family protein [Stutzerimonas stutzeri]CJL65056.1 acetyl-CoA acetyltransferase [Streptococcus pneumoniae]HAJ85913.1 acetyl-CoA C-acyltransferase [Pseudomonas sp.]MBA1306518.1 acetyl-CoA C-acyltransferase family protein [Stutzerimonas stutzeri]MCQ4227539.1 acetyl-CoA C-acyltransferase family protein [Stutzerimonas stutzeri]MDH0444525.1 acetyl-CoA C-acyltransferase family protein [Stutzerimonas stutzeri]
MSERETLVVGAVRTAIGSFGGSLKDIPLASLATSVVRAALERSGVAPERVEHVVMGNVIPTEPKDAYLGRIAAIDAGIPVTTPAFNVNRLCGSGLQAIISAAQAIQLGDASIAIGAGAESMSRGPFLLAGMRWGSRLGDASAIDYMNGVLHDPWQQVHMGITAENVAKRYGISRAQQDALALESQRRASRALAEQRFASQIVPIEVNTRTGTRRFDTDEHVRVDVTAEQLAGMRPVFDKAAGTVTAGNASGLNDGAAAVVLAEAHVARELGLRPLARLVGYAHAGVEPAYMGIGPVPAIRLVLQRTGLDLGQIDVIEANEAFAAQACAVAQELGLDRDKLNPNGSGISLGHPVGATGAIITTKAIHELDRVQGRYALVAMCIGGGQGIAAVFERVDG